MHKSQGVKWDLFQVNCQFSPVKPSKLHKTIRQLLVQLLLITCFLREILIGHFLALKAIVSVALLSKVLIEHQQVLIVLLHIDLRMVVRKYLRLSHPHNRLSEVFDHEVLFELVFQEPQEIDDCNMGLR